MNDRKTANLSAQLGVEIHVRHEVLLDTRIASLDRRGKVMCNEMRTPEQHAKNNRKTLSLLGTGPVSISLITPGDLT